LAPAVHVGFWAAALSKVPVVIPPVQVDVHALVIV
jgi:hypothetical protein